MNWFIKAFTALTYLFFTGTALAADKSGVGGFSLGSSKRAALVYGFNSVSDIHSDTINKYNRADGVSLAYELGMPVSVFAHVNYYQNRDVKVTWKGAPETPVQFYGYTADLGIKFTLPLNAFQPWLGGGYGWGVLTYSNPADREFDNFMIGIYSRGSRPTHSPFGVGGIDISLGTSGVRLAYMLREFTTKKSSYLGNNPYDMKMASFFAGFFVNL